jgi:drug/metabolite transporter (DMT)-like permease
MTRTRLLGPALVLALLVATRRGTKAPRWSGSLVSAVLLFAYAAPFSFAYLRLPAGTGALILFGAVQATMLGWGLRSGERPHAWEWTGLALAVAGLLALTLPGASAADPLGALLMALAGVSWGVYSLLGRGSRDARAATAGNFSRALLPSAALLLLPGSLKVSAAGAGYAVASGAVASGIGYALWYEALRGMSATRAATVQLMVPLLAAAGGVVLLDESVTPRLLGSAAAILGGVGIAVLGRARAA